MENYSGTREVPIQSTAPGFVRQSLWAITLVRIESLVKSYYCVISSAELLIFDTIIVRGEIYLELLC